MTFRQRVNDALVRVVLSERRLHRYYRDGFDRTLRGPLGAVVQGLINLRRKDEHLGIAEEKILPGEEGVAREIVDLMSAYIRKHYTKGTAQRAGNTKTYGVVRGVFEVLPDLETKLRVGVFREPRSYLAWVRFAGPGPRTPPDIEDYGILSIGIKLMGVEGDKIIDDERFTQDFTGLSNPTFTTPHILDNVKLHRQQHADSPALYFFNPFNLRESHIFDGLRQFLYARAQGNPLEVQYYSCVPFLFGAGQAVQFTIKPRGAGKTRVPKSPSDNYLREAMVEMLGKEEVTFDFMVQLQTDPHRMPIEDSSVQWPEKLSPYVPVARLRLPIQHFDTPKQLAFAGNLSFNPWHSLAEHRPLGNLNRARRMMYIELSKLRQEINGEARIEPTGDETFE